MTRLRRGRGRTVADPAVLAGLIDRLDLVGPRTSAGWGRMSAQQMWVHLAVNHDAVLGRASWSTPSRPPSRFVKSPHPIFGRMGRAEWQRWAFLHTDHHLRQFGL